MIVELGIGVMAGFVAGQAYFRGLWWTVQRAVEQHHPALFVGSFVARLAVVGVLAWWLATWSLAALLGAGVGFFVARRVVVAPHREKVTG